MPLVTLITDLGYRDPYLAITKASLLRKLPGADILDLSCDIPQHNISEAAFILRHSLPYFEPGTIHLVGVKFNGKTRSKQKFDHVDNTRYLLAEYKGHYIFCPDNGFLTLLDEEFNEKVYQLYFDDHARHLFFIKDIFAEAAAHLAQGKPIAEIAMETSDYHKVFQFTSFASPGNLKGKSVYVDDFGNIITNISKSEFESVVGRRNFSINLPGRRITELSSTYDDVEVGEPLALFNSFGLLEIAINGGSAFQLLCPRSIGQQVEFQLTIEFDD